MGLLRKMTSHFPKWFLEVIDPKYLSDKGIKNFVYENTVLLHADCFELLSALKEKALSAVVTDPPYGVKEYEVKELEAMREGKPSIWRLPPAFDGAKRSPLPRFTDIKPKEREVLKDFFQLFSESALRALRPGAHMFIATNAHLSPLVYQAVSAGGFEFRTELIRLVKTFRGGDRPKLAEKEFSMACSLPRGGYEPWGIFRKPLGKLRVYECLREYETGALRRISEDSPFSDVIRCERTPKAERELANHPSLKPQELMRQIVNASLPTRNGVIFDPFAGAGSTLAACVNSGLYAIGCEKDLQYYEEAKRAIPLLSNVDANGYDYRQSRLV
jgi:site-specific DNA-methyltransferase (adenine-specific)